MFIRKKGWLRREFDEQLLKQINTLKEVWISRKRFVEQSLDPSTEVICQSKIAEAKYFFLFKELKQRKITVHK